MVAPATDREMEKDLKTLTLFVNVYCREKHRDCDKSLVQLKSHDVQALAGRPVVLCPNCVKLLTHALVKRSHCPMDPKPACKHCPNHCYHPTYRKQIQEVMRFSGKHLLLHGRLDYIFHLLF